MAWVENTNTTQTVITLQQKNIHTVWHEAEHIMLGQNTQQVFGKTLRILGRTTRNIEDAVRPVGTETIDKDSQINGNV